MSFRAAAALPFSHISPTLYSVRTLVAITPYFHNNATASPAGLSVRSAAPSEAGEEERKDFTRRSEMREADRLLPDPSPAHDCGRSQARLFHRP